MAVVCHIPPAVTVTPQPPGRKLPAIPNPGTDINSILATIRALTRVVQIITNQDTTDNGVINNFRTTNTDATWTEDRRVTETVRVTNPEDDSQYVDVERINQLRMKNKDTRQSWVWER